MSFLLEPLFYVPALFWVFISLVVSYQKIVVPTWLSLALLGLLGATNIAFNGVLIGTVSVIIAFLLGLIFAYTSITTRSSTIFLTILFASLPFPAWTFTVVPGLALAGLVGAFKLRRATEKGYLTMLTGETLAGMGASGGIPLVNSPKPDFSRIPVPDSKIEKGNMGKANKIKLRLPVYMLFTIIANIAVAFLIS